MQVNKGFSLIELLTVVSIIGILASISYPTYRDQVVRARRADGKSALLSQALRIETFFNENHSYTDVAKNLGLPDNSSSGFYSINVAVPDPSTGSAYLLTATPQKGQAKNDTECQSFTFNEYGIKGITAGPSGSPTATTDLCWLR